MLTGNAADNVLNGATGSDTMAGGAGNDTYVVDAGTDIVTEALNAGTDTVQTALTYTLGANLENLTLTGTIAVNGTGNALSNVLQGNDGNNALSAGAGDDTLHGYGGADTLIGGAGNDAYAVYDTGDVVVESANEGTDSVWVWIWSSGTFTLGANIENLTLGSPNAFTGIGNELNNIIGVYDGSAANVLNGGGGDDTLNGGAGSDTLAGGAGADRFDFSISATAPTRSPTSRAAPAETCWTFAMCSWATPPARRTLRTSCNCSQAAAARP